MKKKSDPPNVLMIAVDDLRPFLGCYGDENAHTPHIDRLASRGLLFENAMCTAPCCGPSRASLLTGKLPSRTGLYMFQDWAGRKELEDLITLPEFFRRNGYNTFTSGKIHHNSNRTGSYTAKAVEINEATENPDPEVRVPRADREWTVNDLPRVREAKYNHTPCLKDCINWSGEEKTDPLGDVQLVSGPSDDEVEDCQDAVTAAFGENVLGREHEKPFFLATGFVRPHLPFIVPRNYFDLYPLEDLKLHPVKDDDLADVPWSARRNAKVDDDIRIRGADPLGRAKVIQAYYACVSFVDDMIGRVMTALENSDYADNTVVLFWSDHGWHLGEKRSWRKFSLWEESARTPMILLDPRIPEAAGARCSRPVGLLDVYPTLADCCGLDIPEELDGISLVPLLTDPDSDRPEFREPELTIHGRGNYSLRDETWRYSRYFDGAEELYNHGEDPYEWKNLAGDPDYRPVMDRLAAFLPKESAPTFEPCGPFRWADQDRDDMEQFIGRVWPRWVKEAHPPLT